MTDQLQKKILFVDDDRFLLDMYALKFGKVGYDVKTADSAEAATVLLKGGFTPDAVLIDIVMPGTDGLDLVSSMRADHLASGASIMMLTNQGASDDIARAKKLGVDGYIVKATTIPSDVLAEVEKMLATKKS